MRALDLALKTLLLVLFLLAGSSLILSVIPAHLVLIRVNFYGNTCNCRQAFGPKDLVDLAKVVEKVEYLRWKFFFI